MTRLQRGLRRETIAVIDRGTEAGRFDRLPGTTVR
jgi:hypothetical protein